MEDGCLGWLSFIGARGRSKLRRHTAVYYLRISPASLVRLPYSLVRTGAFEGDPAG